MASSPRGAVVSYLRALHLVLRPKLASTYVLIAKSSLEVRGGSGKTVRAGHLSPRDGAQRRQKTGEDNSSFLGHLHHFRSDFDPLKARRYVQVTGVNFLPQNFVAPLEFWMAAESVACSASRVPPSCQKASRYLDSPDFQTKNSTGLAGQ
jgi:hypothetical protein